MRDAQPTRKRAASEPTEALDTGESSSSTAPAGPSSSSTASAVPDRKRATDIPTEDLADSMDIMSLHVGAAYDVIAKGSLSEIYPPSNCAQAEKAGFGSGWSLDLIVTDDQGQPWDFSKHECREKARQLVHKTKPLLLVGSPMCTWFSLLRNLNKKHSRRAHQIRKGAPRHTSAEREVLPPRTSGDSYQLETSRRRGVLRQTPALVRDHYGYVPLRHDVPERKGKADASQETDSLAD